MSKGVIGIFCGRLYVTNDLWHQWDETSLNEGIGGSETWAIYVSNEFVKMGYDVILFADCPHHFSNGGVEYYSYIDFDRICSETKFEYFIVSRFASIISDVIDSKHPYIIAHDNFILEAYNVKELKLHLVDGIFTLSGFQEKQLLKEYPGLDKNVFVRTLLGIDWDLYKNVDTIKKKNKMVWSSDKSRGAGYLIKKIYPIIKKEIPDFEIDVCGYANNMTDDYFKCEGINIKGRLSKSELAELQKESKIWVYPNHGHFEDGTQLGETFCITAVENAAAKNALVIANKHAFIDTLNGYNGFIGDECFYDSDWLLPVDKLDEFAVKLAEQAIRILKNDEYRESLATQAYNICKKYTWHNAAKNLLYQIDGRRMHAKSSCYNNVNTRLVYHLWLPDVEDSTYNEIMAIHMYCLRYYSKIFDDALFVISYDNYDKNRINDIEKEIIDFGFSGNVSFKLVENDSLYRESKTYFYEVLDKMEKLDGITFFAYNFGYNELLNENTIKENIYKWVSFMYFMNLSIVNNVKCDLLRPHAISHGTFKMKYNNTWSYLGGFQWLNTMSLYDHISKKPKSCNVGLIENYIPDNVYNNNDFVKTYKHLCFTYDDDLRCLMNKDIDAVIGILASDESLLNEYNNFYKKLTNSLNNE